MLFPEQTQYLNPHYRGWGCYATDLCLIGWSFAKGLTPSTADIEAILDKAVSMGIITDNDIPVGSPGWYRAFVDKPEALIKLSAQSFGVSATATEFYRGSPVTRIPPANFTIIEWKTDQGSHFTMGDGKVGDLIPFDPWPSLPRGQVITFRHWVVK